MQITGNMDTLVLDSFDGSGATAHAVLNMDKADGGHRKFILVEMMETRNSSPSHLYSTAPVVVLQHLHIIVALRRGVLKYLYVFCTVAVCDPVGKAIRKILPAVGFGVVTEAGITSFQLVKPFPFCGVVQNFIKKMPEFMESSLGVRDVNRFIRIAGSSDTAHAELFAEISHIFEIDNV